MIEASLTSARIMPPTLSIITPWLDHPEFIGDYERAVAAEGVQVIIIDNGSSRLVADVLESMVRRLGGIYIRNEQNKWFSAANNQGLALATGRIVLFMNNDVSASPGWLQAVWKEVAANGLYGPSLRKRVLEETETQYIEGWCIAGVRDVWDRLGGWNAQTFQLPYWEDAELCWRASRMGIGLHQTNWEVIHKVGGTSASVSTSGLAIRLNKDAFLAVVRGQDSQPPSPATDPSSQPPPLEHYLQSGRLSDAERDYQQAVQRQPHRADLHLGYSLVLACCGRGEAAQFSFQRALSLNPQIAADAYTELGIVLDKLRKYPEASAAFAQVARLRPQSWVARCNWAAALIQAEHYDEAADAARAAIALNGAWGPAHGELAHAYLRSGRLQEALHEAQTASRLEPPHFTTFFVLASVLKGLRRPQEAMAALDRALAINPAEPTCQQLKNSLLEMLSEKK